MAYLIDSPNMICMIQIVDHPIVSALLAGVVIFVAVFLLTCYDERLFADKKTRGEYFVTLTPAKMIRTGPTEVRQTEESASFEPRLVHYMKTAEVMVTLSAATLVFIPGLHLLRPLPWLAFPMVLFGFTVVAGVAFMALLTYFYEEFLYDPRRYTPFKSALSATLGFCGLAYFGLAYFVLAIQVGRAFSSGWIGTK
jgi:hypothetical protein